jgi:hypothetical protein
VLHLPSLAGLFTVQWEVSLLPSPVELSSHHHFYKLSRSKVAGWGLPRLPPPAGLFIYSSVRDCRSPIFGAQDAPPSLLHVFLLLLFIQFGFFLFFPWAGVSLSRGATLIWPSDVCGSTTCCLAHLVVCFS